MEELFTIFLTSCANSEQIEGRNGRFRPVFELARRLQKGGWQFRQTNTRTTTMSCTEGNGPTYSILDYVRMRPEQIFHVLGNGLGFDDCIYQMLQIVVDR